VDWIIQLAAPKDPSFFIHRIGRTARAGKSGGALLFISEHERAYIELLRGRHVPLEETVEEEIEEATRTGVLNAIKGLAMEDRDVLEKGSTAFMAFLRSYQEHLCSFIFRIEELDIGSVAKSYGLLRLPKIPETRGKKLIPIVFENTEINTSTIPYRHKEKEIARVKKQEKIRSEHAKSAENGTIEASAINSAKKKEWDADYEMKRDDKRKRKKKQSKHQQIMDEWDELAVEETLFRKFKKGKLSKTEYDDLLTSDEVIETSRIHDDDDNGLGASDEDEMETDAIRAKVSRISNMGSSAGGSSSSKSKSFVKGDYRNKKKNSKR
jgi:ATP-dependent RNA helicase DDX55/SPB4